MSKNRSHFTAYRLCINGILIALFFVLSLPRIEIAGVKVTFAPLATVLSAMLFGPVDALLVGFLGAFMEQMLHFGFTATTLLWVLPPAIRGLTLGLLLKPARSGLDQRRPAAVVWCFAAALMAGVLVSVGNTFVFYADSKLFHYYNYAMVFGVFWWRIFTGALISTVTCLVALPVRAALVKSGLVPKKGTAQ